MPISRRTTLKSSFAALGAATLTIPVSATDFLVRAPGLLVVKDRDIDPQDIQRTMSSRPMFEFIGDPTFVWYENVRPYLVRGSRHLVGITSPNTAFHFQQLALDFGLFYTEEIDFKISNSSKGTARLWTASELHHPILLPTTRVV